ncbi:actinorhodin polyketide synthase acyl carrier protein [Streptomyces humidus]|uniref:Actinorhodin polyketide synthase acyl carrier protein n=1 Tax=Streptomyces humidus TaxID=52259 RepID=A0A918L5U2_9ACTN|nr:acyl carrier protein [Streptomyces humidus]GGS05543.1 actinorhodin polyketide synthase acyl carrier protein [Streptomyces humidus]
MSTFTLDELVRVLRESAGEEEGVDLEGDILDVPFDDLGYDSLALLNTVIGIQQAVGVTLPDDIVSQELTPRLLLDLVNGHIARPAAGKA